MRAGIGRIAALGRRGVQQQCSPSARRIGAREARFAPALRIRVGVEAMRFIDIGANLLDPMFRGEYGGKPAHDGDLDAVLDRAWAAGVERIIVTAGSLAEARAVLELCERHERLFATVGVHPTRCGSFDEDPDGPESHLLKLIEVAQEGIARGKVVAVGECGLDYARLHFCEAEVQRKYFAMQFR